MFKRFFIFLSLSFLASCVPNKDLIYLQGEPITKKNVYKLNDEPYRLQVDDVLSIELKAENEKYVALFKKTNTPFQTGNTSNGFETGTSPQVGYRIDRHGNIR